MDSVAGTVAGMLAKGGEVRRVRLRKLRVSASIGIHDFEKRKRQPITVDVDLYVRPQAAAGDDIEKALNYDFLRQAVLDLVNARHYNLQETLAEAIMAECLRPEQVLAARVATEKPDVYPDCDGIGFELTRVKPA